MSGPGQSVDEEPDVTDASLREIARVEEVAPPAPLVGQTLGHFRILSELGRGGMGIVYLAHDEHLRRAVALKLLQPSLTRQAERHRRFVREARAAASVTHPSLATIYGVGEVEGNVFIAMDHVEGRTLRKLLAAGPLPILAVVQFSLQILGGPHHGRVGRCDAPYSPATPLASGQLQRLAKCSTCSRTFLPRRHS